MGRTFSSVLVPFVAVGIGLCVKVGVEDAPPVEMAEVTSPRSVSEDVRVLSLLEVREAELVIADV